MWTWAQAAGLIEIEGTFKDELAKQNITEELPFVVSDPHFIYSNVEENTYVVTPFLGGQNDIIARPEANYIVNGEFQPTFTMQPGETKWIRYLTATTENLNNFRIINKATGAIVPVWDAASDGINYASPVQVDQFVFGGGQRQDVSFLFSVKPPAILARTNRIHVLHLPISR